MSNSPPKDKHTRAGQRLARISHHFLSEPPSESGSNDKTSTQHRRTDKKTNLYFIDSHSSQDFPTLVLAIQLAHRGINCSINQHGHPNINISPTINLKDRPNKDTNDDTPSVQLYSDHNIDAIPYDQPYTLLLPTQATPSGLQLSFLKLKHHLHTRPPLRTGITITNTADMALAKYYFIALHQAHQQFLSHHTAHKLYSYGLIMHPNHQDISPEIDGIAQLIIKDCTSSATLPKTKYCESPS